MRLAEKQILAVEKAKAILPPEIYSVLSAAMISGALVRFVYTNRYGVKKEYVGEHPHSFFEMPQDEDWPGSVLLWSRHSAHFKNEQYRVERISGVQKVVTLMDAMLDPSVSVDFWSGKTQTVLEVA